MVYTGDRMLGTAGTKTPGSVLSDVHPPVGNPLVHLELGTVALVYAATLTVDTTTGSAFSCTLTGALTINALAPGILGQEVTFLLTSDATPRTTTFGTNFKPTGTLVGTASKACSITFRCLDGISWWEVARAGAAGGTSGM